MTTRTRTYGRFCAIPANSLALAVGSCSGNDGSGKAPDDSMAPGKLCGGGAVVGVGTAVILGPAAGAVAPTAVPLVMDAATAAIDTGYAGETAASDQGRVK